MKKVRAFWRSLFAGASHRENNGLVRMFEVEYANEARQLRKVNGGLPLSPQFVEEYLNQMRKR